VRAATKHRIEQVFGSITAAGYETLYAFVDKLLNIRRDQQFSSRVFGMPECPPPLTSSLKYFSRNVMRGFGVQAVHRVRTSSNEALKFKIQPLYKQTVPARDSKPVDGPFFDPLNGFLPLQCPWWQGGSLNPASSCLHLAQGHV
jgi:hypothetical protein